MWPAWQAVEAAMLFMRLRESRWQLDLGANETVVKVRVLNQPENCEATDGVDRCFEFARLQVATKQKRKNCKFDSVHKRGLTNIDTHCRHCPRN